MDLPTLDMFRTVAREQGVTRAAERLGRVPSNVTTRIRQLETELGVPLFDRAQKKMLLTAEGALFLGYAERILALAEEARQRLAPAGPSGLLRVGSMESTLASRLPAPLARFARDWPEVTLELFPGPSRMLIEALGASRIDCALVAVPAEVVPQEAGFLDLAGIETCPLHDETLVLLLPPGHPPTTDPRQVRAGGLAAFAPGCTYRMLAETWLAGQGELRAEPHPPAMPVREVGSYHAMQALTAAGRCISLMPRSVARMLGTPEAVQAVPLMQVTTHLAWRKGYDTASLRAFREMLTGWSWTEAPG